MTGLGLGIMVLYLIWGFCIYGYIEGVHDECIFHLLTMFRWIVWWPVMLILGYINKDKYVMIRVGEWKKFFKFHFTEMKDGE